VLTTLLAKKCLNRLKDLFGILRLRPRPLMKGSVAIASITLLATIEVVIVVESG
jgi:hypothetical protein